MKEERNLSRLRVGVCSYSLPVQGRRELRRKKKKMRTEEGEEVKKAKQQGAQPWQLYL